MKIIGIDPSSSICGIALIKTGRGAPEILKVANWKRDDNRSSSENLSRYYEWLGSQLVFTQPEMAIIEFLSVTRNAQATRMVAFYQAVSALCCKQRGLVVIETRVRTARKHALGNGALSKDDAWEIMKKRYPNLFSAKTRGGLDEMDALVLALSGPTVAEI